jgi:hypothetical protein
LNLTAFIGYHGQKWFNNLRNLFTIGDESFNNFNDINTENPNNMEDSNDSNPKDPLKYAVKIYNNLHLLDTQLAIRKDNKRKSGIYGIYNIINEKLYIGSAISNRINFEFNRHCFLNTGDLNIKNDIKLYGLNNFTFIIFKYYPGIIIKENFKLEHLKLLTLLNLYILKFNPVYNNSQFDITLIKDLDIFTLAIKIYNHLNNINTH